MSQFQAIVKKKNRNGVGYNKRFQESGPDVVSTPCNVHVTLESAAARISVQQSSDL